MYFLQFCKSITKQEICTMPDVNDCVDPRIMDRAEILFKQMRTKTNIFDRIEIPYIESELQDQDKVQRILMQYNDGDIPDYLFRKFSELFHKPFNDLNIDEQSIVKTLSVYVCMRFIQSLNTN